MSFLKIELEDGKIHRLNLDNVVSIDSVPARESGVDEEGEMIYPSPLIVEITTSAFTTYYYDGGEYYQSRTETRPLVYRFRGEEAEEILYALDGLERR
jgi:hypothetical protein